MSITVLGVNHRTAPLEVRERFAHAPREVPIALERVLAAGARGGVLLSTCNRTEFYVAEAEPPVPEIVWTLLSERLGDGRNAGEYGYIARDRDAVRHLYRVSAGPASIVPRRARAPGGGGGGVGRPEGGAPPGPQPPCSAASLSRGPGRRRSGAGGLGRREGVAAATARRGGGLLWILDRGVPGDVEPAVAQLENVFLYDVDDLQAVAAQAAAARRSDIPAAERIVGEEVERFWGWYGARVGVPVLKEVRDRLEAVRAAEPERAPRRLGHLSLPGR